MRTAILRNSIILFVALTPACSSPTASTSTPNGVYGGSRLASKTVKTCWENPTADILVAGEKATTIVGEVFTAEYQRAGFTFDGWAPCTAVDQPQQVVHIRIADQQPWGLYGCKTAETWCVTVNFDFTAWPHPGGEACSPSTNKNDAWGCYCQGMDRRKSCVQSYGLHELGHALGLAHEADHRQNIDGRYCRQTTSRDTNAVDIGPYDPDSVMNYCKNQDQVVNNYRASLSNGDLATLATIYQD